MHALIWLLRFTSFRSLVIHLFLAIRLLGLNFISYASDDKRDYQVPAKVNS